MANKSDVQNKWGRFGVQPTDESQIRAGFETLEHMVALGTVPAPPDSAQCPGERSYLLEKAMEARRRVKEANPKPNKYRKSRLRNIKARITAYQSADTKSAAAIVPVQVGVSGVISVARPTAVRIFADTQHEKLAQFLDLVIDKIGLESFLSEYPDLKRTPVMDYKAGRLKGKVSSEKRVAIEAAIQASAAKHGLINSN